MEHGKDNHVDTQVGEEGGERHTRAAIPPWAGQSVTGRSAAHRRNMLVGEVCNGLSPSHERDTRLPQGRTVRT